MMKGRFDGALVIYLLYYIYKALWLCTVLWDYVVDVKQLLFGYEGNLVLFYGAYISNILFIPSAVSSESLVK